MKPYRASEVYEYVYPDTLYNFKRIAASERFFRRAYNIVFFEQLLDFDETGYIRKSVKDSIQPGVYVRNNYTDTSYVKRKFHIIAQPFVRFDLGYDASQGRTITYNKRGVALSANIGQKVSLFTSFTENQAKFAEYLTRDIRAFRVVPQEGKARNFGTTSFDFNNFWAYINYAPNKYFNIEVGNGKHFIGNGYRSLFLSDNSFVYPYLKTTINVWKIKYQLIYTELQNDIRETNDFALGVTRKIANFNYLSIAPTNWLQLGVFEGIVWRRTGPEGNNEFNWNFINPIIGIRGFQKKLDVNSVYGLNYQVKFPHYTSIYGQWMINKFPTDGWNQINNRMGMQIGFKYFDVGKVENLNLQLEYNRVRPYSYTTADSIIHYSHYEAPLAHPLGANFSEFYGKVSYRYKRLYAQLSMNYSKGGVDVYLVKEGNNDEVIVDYTFQNGSNLFANPNLASQTEQLKIGSQASTYNLLHTDLKIGYIINPKMNLRAELGVTRRRSNSNLFAYNAAGEIINENVTNTATIFNFSIATQLFNNYYDNISRLIFAPDAR